MKSLFIALLMFCPAAFAERTVGNGGGLAEMRAIYLHQNLATYLKPCLVKPAACGLKDSETESFSNAVRAAAAAKPVNLKIDHSVSESEVLRVEPRAGGLIHVSPKALYKKNGSVAVPKTSAEIAGLMLAGFWLQSGISSKTEALERAALVTERFEETSDELEVFSKPLLKVHHQTLRFGATEELVVLIEDESKTIQAAESLFATLSCASTSEKPVRSDLQNMRIIQREPRQVTAALELVNECAQGLAYQTLLLSFELDTKGEVIPSSVQTKLTESL